MTPKTKMNRLKAAAAKLDKRGRPLPELLRELLPVEIEMYSSGCCCGDATVAWREDRESYADEAWNSLLLWPGVRDGAVVGWWAYDYDLRCIAWGDFQICLDAQGGIADVSII